jgi:hypothetical protein
MLIGVADDEPAEAADPAARHGRGKSLHQHPHHSLTAGGDGSGSFSSHATHRSGGEATDHPHPAPLPAPAHEWKADPVCQRRSRAMYRALLTEGMDRWPQFIIDLVVLTLAAAPNLARYTGKVRLYAELDAYEQWNLYSGPGQLHRRRSATPRGSAHVRGGSGQPLSASAATTAPPSPAAARGPPLIAVAAGSGSSSGGGGTDGAAADATTAIPDSVRLASRVRHRDIIALACTDTLLLLVKAMRVG